MPYCIILLFVFHLNLNFKFKFKCNSFFPLFLIGPGPPSLFFFLVSFLPCGPTQLGLFPPLLFSSAAQPSSFFLSSSVRPSFSLPRPSPPAQPASLSPPPSLTDRQNPPFGAVPDLEPDSGSSPSLAGARVQLRHGTAAPPRVSRARMPRCLRPPYKTPPSCPTARQTCSRRLSLSKP
jgi:hypothetical protein